ncbi:MAG: hypothetical protein ACI30A_02695 [Paludibacteraceae bacterium]
MENNNVELSLLSAEEREQLEFIWNLIPSVDKQNLSKDDVLAVLDAMDDYLEDKGLLLIDEQNGEAEYKDGDIDETEQLAYVQQTLKEQGFLLTGEQIQLIMDGELQYGIQQGYYEE